MTLSRNMRPFECEIPEGGELQVLAHLFERRAKLTIRPSKDGTDAYDWTIKLPGESSWAKVFRTNGRTHLSFLSVAIFDYLDEVTSRGELGYKWIWPTLDGDHERPEALRSPITSQKNAAEQEAENPTPHR